LLAGAGVAWLTAFDRHQRHDGGMSHIVTRVELLEIVPSLRAMAAAEPTSKVKEAMIRLADRYAAMISRSPPYYHLGAAGIRDATM
jgi:hypothetical protein